MRLHSICGCVGVLLVACGSTTDEGGAQPSGTTDPTTPTTPPSVPPGTTPPSEDAGTDAQTEPEEVPVPYVHYDVNHVISTGQSNSVAHEAREILSTSQPFANVMFDVGVMTSGVCEAQGCRTYQKPSAFVPLREGDSFWYPVETMSSGLGNEAAMLARTKYALASHDLLVSLAGRNGLTYWCLRKGGCNFIDPSYLNAFEENMRQVQDGKAIATAAGKSYVVRAVTAIHGESDDFAYATGTQEFPLDGTDGRPGALTSYADALLEWQRDYEAGVKAITGQTEAVPLFISQFSGWNDIDRSAVTQFQFEAMVRSNGKVMIVAPAYTLEWDDDCRHYTSHGERHLGEYFAKAYARVVLEGRRWEPLRPQRASLGGNVITAKFLVPTPPLVLDTDRVTDPGSYGFEVVDENGMDLPIAGVTLAGPDTVTITLVAAPPAAAKPHLRYAFKGVPHSCPGRFVGPRGNLRDSDATPSQHGYELFNWAVHFDVPIE